jgi:hypothetical protein
MSDINEPSWADVEAAATKMFSVWHDGSELEWAKEVWGHLYAAGLVGGETVVEVTVANLRLVALARIYQEFSGLAWDENPETPMEYLAEDLKIDPVALGILAAAGDIGEFEDFTEECDLREAALIAATNAQRAELFQCLKTAYGGETQLYTRLWHTRSADVEEDSEYEEFNVTGPNSMALKFVMNGFREG